VADLYFSPDFLFQKRCIIDRQYNTLNRVPCSHFKTDLHQTSIIVSSTIYAIWILECDVITVGDIYVFCSKLLFIVCIFNSISEKVTFENCYDSLLTYMIELRYSLNTSWVISASFDIRYSICIVFLKYFQGQNVNHTPNFNM
jgi:hypothetical protein